MKPLLLLFITFFAFKASASISDTTIVEFTEKEINKRIVVKNNNNRSFEIPLKLNLDNLLKEMGVDSAERNEAHQWLVTQLNSIDSLVIKSGEGEILTISTKEARKGGSTESQQDRDYEDRFDFGDTNSAKNNETNKSDDDPITINIKQKKFFSKSDFGLYLGINSLLSNNNSAPELRLWRSRYVALSFRKHLTLSQNENVAIAFSYAPEIAWHNFMFENSNGIVEENGMSQVSPLDINTEKSKLVMPHLNLPVMFHFGSVKSKFKVGLGAYVGYRIGGYSKTKDTSNDKEKIKSDFGMNNFQYGLTAEIGHRRGLTLFTRYSLQELFKSNQTSLQGLNPISFGIRI